MSFGCREVVLRGAHLAEHLGCSRSMPSVRWPSSSYVLRRRDHEFASCVEVPSGRRVRRGTPRRWLALRDRSLDRSSSSHRSIPSLAASARSRGRPRSPPRTWTWASVIHCSRRERALQRSASLVIAAAAAVDEALQAARPARASRLSPSASNVGMPSPAIARSASAVALGSLRKRMYSCSIRATQLDPRCPLRPSESSTHVL